MADTALIEKLFGSQPPIEPEAMTAGNIALPPVAPPIEPPATPESEAGPLVTEAPASPPETAPATQGELLSVGLGCQCEKCRQTGGNKDKRGRHHKGCPCEKCRPASGAQPQPDFSDLTGGTVGQAPAATSPSESGQSVVGIDNDAQFNALAALTFDMTVNSLSSLFGPEWQPQAPEERKVVCDATAAYMKSRGIKDLPPGAMLAVVVCMYAAPRLSKPNTKQKLFAAWVWFKSKFARKR